MSVAALVALAAAAPLSAQAAATQTVTFEVDAISVMSTSGAVTLHITSSDVTAGSSSTLSKQDATTNYAFTTNDNGASSHGKTIQGALNSNMPSNVSLKVTLAAPGTGSSAGATALTTTAANLVSGITPTNAASSTITYKLEADVTAGAQAQASRTVSFTIIDTP
jgi:hypothetical protein